MHPCQSAAAGFDTTRTVKARVSGKPKAPDANPTRDAPLGVAFLQSLESPRRHQACLEPVHNSATAVHRRIAPPEESVRIQHTFVCRQCCRCAGAVPVYMQRCARLRAQVLCLPFWCAVLLQTCTCCTTVAQKPWNECFLCRDLSAKQVV